MLAEVIPEFFCGFLQTAYLFLRPGLFILSYLLLSLHITIFAFLIEDLIQIYPLIALVGVIVPV